MTREREREGRGKLSSLELIPEDGADDITWAIAELNSRRRTQADILFELNDRLAVKGIDPISKSAFNRASLRLSAKARKIIERKQIYAGIAPELTPEAIAQNDLILGEFVKTLIDDLLDREDLTPKNAMELARAYRETVAGQQMSGKANEEAEARLQRRAAKAIDAVAKAKGLTADTVTEIKARILGVQKPKPPDAEPAA